MVDLTKKEHVENVCKHAHDYKFQTYLTYVSIKSMVRLSGICHFSGKSPPLGTYIDANAPPLGEKYKFSEDF